MPRRSKGEVAAAAEGSALGPGTPRTIDFRATSDAESSAPMHWRLFDPDGLPAAHPVEASVSRIVTGLATVWFAGVASWELFGPILAGHSASSASVGIAGENMLVWHLLGPVLEYTPKRPPPSLVYCHHPWGIFWLTAALLKLFGRHDFVCRLAPVLLSTATPLLLHGLGRALWRPAAGAAAALGFVVLPITLAFANFNALEVPVIAWSLLGLYGFVRHRQTSRRRYLLFSLLGTMFAIHSDWPAYILLGVMLGFGLVRVYFLRRAFGPIRDERGYAQWWIFTATVAVTGFVFYLGVFHHYGKLNDLISAYAVRAGGDTTPLAKVLEERRYWIELCFTPIAIALGKVGAGVALLRLLLLRRELEVISLAVLTMATVQYVVFKQGADIHIFWPHYFGAYFALAMGQLVAAGAPALGWLIARLGRTGRLPSAIAHLGPRSGLVALGCAALALLGVLRDAIPALRYARETGGRFNEKGKIIDSDGDKNEFLRWVDREAPANAVIAMHSGMKNTWAQNWTLARRIVRADQVSPTPSRRGEGIYLADCRMLSKGTQDELVGQFHVTAVGPFWRVVGTEPSAPLFAYSFVEREPTWWEWYLVSGTEPQRAIVPDPYLTWELRTHFGQPAQVPTAPPEGLQQRRIAHNIAVFQRDAGRAAALAAELERELRLLHAHFHDGTEIVGASYSTGARSMLTLYLRATAPTSRGAQLDVTSRVIARAPASTTMADPTVREVSLPLAIPPERWVRGFLYADPVPIQKRPGTEVYSARWIASGKDSEVEVLRLPAGE